jgi:hypothetical protein
MDLCASVESEFPHEQLAKVKAMRRTKWNKMTKVWRPRQPQTAVAVPRSPDTDARAQAQRMAAKILGFRQGAWDHEGDSDLTVCRTPSFAARVMRMPRRACPCVSLPSSAGAVLDRAVHEGAGRGEGARF